VRLGQACSSHRTYISQARVLDRRATLTGHTLTGYVSHGRSDFGANGRVGTNCPYCPSQTAVQISRSEAPEATISSSEENWGFNVIGNFLVPLHALAKRGSLSSRLSGESASLIRLAGLVLERRRRKVLRLYLVSVLIRSDQPLV
jgi:hypothetical protein